MLQNDALTDDVTGTSSTKGTRLVLVRLCWTVFVFFEINQSAFDFIMSHLENYVGRKFIIFN